MKHPAISERGQKTPPSPIRKLVPFAQVAIEKGVNLLSMNIGQPDIQTPPEYYEALKANEGRIVAYGPTNGMPEFLEAMCGYYHRTGLTHLDVNDINITTGGSEAILFTIMAIASPGDEILVFEPFYANFEGFASMAGVKTVAVPSIEETGYGLPSRDVIESKITSKTRGIYYCSPNNPTGYIMSLEELNLLKEIAHQYGLYIISDEVYREFAYDREHISLLSIPDMEEHAIMVDSVSKRHSACGARVGSIVTKNKDILATVLKFGQARLCPPTFEQLGLTAVINHGDQYFPAFINEYKSRRDVIVEGLSAIPGVLCRKPPGSFHMIAQFPVKDIEGFCKWMLTEFSYNNETVFMAPGPGFYMTPGKGVNEARLTYVHNADILKRAVKVLEKALEAYPDK